MSGLDELDREFSSLEPASVRLWLASEGWALTSDRPGVAEIWSSATPRGSHGIRDVLLPLRQDYSDFARRYREALSDLQNAFELDSVGLLERVASVSSDLFFVRMQQESVDSTIPFGQATELMGSIQKMVRAAATSAANPKHSHRGRRPALVADFLDDDLRFGHTKRGSFIMTVAARIPSQPLPESVSAEEPTHEGEPNAQPTAPVPFQRQVMSTLANGLHESSRIATSESADDFDLEDAALAGVSLELVQSVLDVGDFEGLQQLDLSFEWAKTVPTPPAVQEVSISSRQLIGLESMRQYMTKAEPVDDVTIIGRVAALSREEVTGGREDMSVIVEAELFERMRKVHVPLLESDYQWAIYAHQRRLPFTVSGTPIKKRSWQLGGVVKADLTFLKAERDRRKD